MNIEKIEAALISKYPDKRIVRLPQENPTEIICEVEPTSEHPDYSVAVAAIDKSEPHYHRESTETYTVLSGRLLLKLADEREVVLYPHRLGFVIQPYVVHSAETDGEDTVIVKVTSRPGWTPQDHVLVDER